MDSFCHLLVLSLIFALVQGAVLHPTVNSTSDALRFQYNGGQYLTGWPERSASENKSAFHNRSISWDAEYTRWSIEYTSVHRLPECTSISLSWKARYQTVQLTTTYKVLGQPFTLLGVDDVPFPSSLSVLYSGNPTTSNPYYCCEQCYITWPNVKVLYWPPGNADTECLSDYGESPHAWADIAGGRLPSGDGGGDSEEHGEVGLGVINLHEPDYDFLYTGYPENGAAANYINQIGIQAFGLDDRTTFTNPISSYEKVDGDGVLPIVTVVGSDGFVYTSPSIYYEVLRIGATDGCGYVGEHTQSGPLSGTETALSSWGGSFTNVRLSLPPESVSTVIPLGGMGCFGAFFFGTNSLISSACSWATQSFDFNHIPCPPESLRKWGNHSFIYDPKSVYAPLLAPHPDLTKLNPAWESCKPLFGWDPFSVLHPQTAMLYPTSSNHHITLTAEPGATVPTEFAPVTQQSMMNHLVANFLPLLPSRTKDSVPSNTGEVQVQQPQVSDHSVKQPVKQESDTPQRATESNTGSVDPEPDQLAEEEGTIPKDQSQISDNAGPVVGTWTSFGRAVNGKPMDENTIPAATRFESDEAVISTPDRSVYTPTGQPSVGDHASTTRPTLETSSSSDELQNHPTDPIGDAIWNALGGATSTSTQTSSIDHKNTTDATGPGTIGSQLNGTLQVGEAIMRSYGCVQLLLTIFTMGYVVAW